MTSTPRPFTPKPLISSFAGAAGRAEGSVFQREGRLNLMPEDSAQAADMDMARFIMALRARGLRNTALMAAFEKVSRREFFAEELRPYVYADIALPMACGEQATSAHVIAHVLNQAVLLPETRVLEIGTGSGYQTALIASMVESIVSIERYRTLAGPARKALRQFGLNNAELRVGNGLSRHDLPTGKFDCIILNGSVADLPEALIDCLAEDGVLIAPMILESDGKRSQELRRIAVREDGLHVESFAAGRFSPLIDARSAAL